MLINYDISCQYSRYKYLRTGMGTVLLAPRKTMILKVQRLVIAHHELVHIVNPTYIYFHSLDEGW